MMASLYAGDITISGKVIAADSGEPVAYANVILEDESGTITDRAGKFLLSAAGIGGKITISHIAFRDTTLIIHSKNLGIIRLMPTVLPGRDVLVTVTRAIEGVTPVAFSNVSAEEIEMRYTVEDVPMILALEPGVYSYSESGNGTGYSYVQIRGFDQSRIAVMLDNVPLNDNESHQVYWVDHADILADAHDIQIQRGIGNSLYGAAAFGGSINVQTRIAQPEPELALTTGYGTYNTQKISLQANSGEKMGENLSVYARFSAISSDGYREYHDSRQKAFAAGIEHRHRAMKNQLRVLIGYENANLAWDGVPAVDIKNRKTRRQGYKAYTDDFLQQIYSLNTLYQIHSGLVFRNVAYLVMGSGYYEVVKSGENYYKYNLDVTDQYPDSVEWTLETDLLRRKWVENRYFGITPGVTFLRGRSRIDAGMELRSFVGDHYGRVKNFSEDELLSTIGSDWYQYYNYIGEKLSATAFLHAAIYVTDALTLMADLQYQRHQWQLDQHKIGHAAGHQLSADWNFINPRFGAMYRVNEQLSVFANYGKAHKEPADDQIINADDVTSEPVMAAAEAIDDHECGFQFRSQRLSIKANAFRIDFDNEQLKNIDVEQEGEYEYYQADRTLHQGLEVALGLQAHPRWSISLNGSLGNHIFSSGELQGNRIPNVPNLLFNGIVTVKPLNFLSMYITTRYVGKQYIDDENIGKNSDYLIFDGGVRIDFKHLEISAKVNNIFDVLYSTYGYGYEWEGYWAYYWPGATRNAFVSLSVKL
ncbi:MAG: TonB-dependent receptor [Fidelibacterota bacterium]